MHVASTKLIAPSKKPFYSHTHGSSFIAPKDAQAKTNSTFGKRHGIPPLFYALSAAVTLLLVVISTKCEGWRTSYAEYRKEQQAKRDSIAANTPTDTTTFKTSPSSTSPELEEVIVNITDILGKLVRGAKSGNFVETTESTFIQDSLGNVVRQYSSGSGNPTNRTGRSSGSSVGIPDNLQAAKIRTLYDNSNLVHFSPKAKAFVRDPEITQTLINAAKEMGVIDPSYFYILFGAESGLDPTAKVGQDHNNPDGNGLDQMYKITLYDVLKNAPQADALRLLNYFSFEDELERPVSSSQILSIIQESSQYDPKNNPNRLCEQWIQAIHIARTQLPALHQIDIAITHIKLQMQRESITRIENLPEFILRNLLPAKGRRVREMWEALKRAPEGQRNDKFQEILNYPVMVKGDAYYNGNIALDGGQYDFKTRRVIKPGIDGKITVAEVLNYYYSTCYPRALEHSNIKLAPMAALAFQYACRDFEELWHKKLPIIDGLRSARDHHEIYDDLGIDQPFARSVHLFGYAFDLSFKNAWKYNGTTQSRLTRDERQAAIDMLARYGFTRPWANEAKGTELNHFEFRGVPINSKAFQNARFVEAYLEIAAATPPLGGFIDTHGMPRFFYFLPNKDIRNHTNVGEAPALGLQTNPGDAVYQVFNLAQ